MAAKRIGIFDSGVGGLSVLNALIDLPIPEFLYFADTANLPYGTKTKSQIIDFTSQAVQFLQSRQVDAVVIACHTAATNASDALAERFPDLPIMDVAKPAVIDAVTRTKNKRIGVIATPATVASGMHKANILQLLPDATVLTQPCPQLVPLIESGASAHEIAVAVEGYVRPLVAQGIDTLIIGCTHYELIKDHIADCVGNEVGLVSAPVLIREMMKGQFGDTKTANIHPSIEYFVTGNKEQFHGNVVRLFPHRTVSQCMQI